MIQGGADIERKVWALLEPVIAVDGFELIEVEYTSDQGRMVLRLYIDKPEGGVTVRDTTHVTELVDPVLDVEDPIPNAYFLEVSSPGLDRPLRKPEHFERHAGSEVRIKTRISIEGAGNRKNFAGILKGYSDGVVRVDVDGHLFEVPHQAIQKARVVYRFDEERR